MNGNECVYAIARASVSISSYPTVGGKRSHAVTFIALVTNGYHQSMCCGYCVVIVIA